MPGFVIHLSIAKEIVKLIEKNNSAQWNSREKEEFYIGNILPDIKKTKKLSHYWGSKQMKYILRIPDLDKFLKYNGSKLMNRQVLGYYCHLIVDKIFYEDFLPEVVCFMDNYNNPTNSLKAVQSVHLYKRNMDILYEDFWTGQYYYGDFDKLNPVLRKKYEINTAELIKETDNSKLNMNKGQYLHLKNELKKYLNKSRTGDLKVFQRNDMEKFINKTAKIIFKKICFEFEQDNAIIEKIK